MLTRRSGPISLVRPEGTTASLTAANQPDRHISLPRRTLRDCLSEELRRLDADDIYAEVLSKGLPLVNAGGPAKAARPKAAPANAAPARATAPKRTRAKAAAKDGAADAAPARTPRRRRATAAPATTAPAASTPSAPAARRRRKAAAPAPAPAPAPESADAVPTPQSPAGSAAVTE